MDALNQCLLNLWRLAAHHWRLDDNLGAVAAELGPVLVVHRLLVLELDPGGTRLSPAAHWGLAAPIPAPLAAAKPVPAVPMTLSVPSSPANPDASRSPMSRAAARDMDRLRAWCREGHVIQGTAATVAGQLPGLVPPAWPGEVLALGLVTGEDPLGVLLIGADPPARWGEEPRTLLPLLAEPIALALRNHQRLRELLALREAAEADRRSLLARLGRRELTDTLIGADAGLREVMRGVELVAPAAAPVLILGETGSGKEVIARAIHGRSARAQGPFLRVNCGAIPPDLVDSELFGHEKGSFTGAGARRLGWFERADRGTLFLDEIGELAPSIQVRLLRILQDGSFERVGGQQTLHVDVRLIAATHRDLRAMVGDGQFRADLWYRINVFPLHLPALRERPEDIPALANHFAEKAAVRLGLALQLPTPADLALLRAYPWPGNVRELAAVIERAAILGDGQGLEVERALGTGPLLHGAQLPAQAANANAAHVTGNGSTAAGTRTGNGSAATATAAASAATATAAGGANPAIAPAGIIEPLDVAIRQHIERALAQCHGRVEGPFGAARLLAVNPDTLRSRMRKLGISRAPFRP
ncbi:MAG: sigma-54 dependent transcriptional regulator [Chromatiaceae bacterium]|nr:sigma-54 dependent transcriptional regulator [Candidatus Thioaporhodococcus sediminis]